MFALAVRMRVDALVGAGTAGGAAWGFMHESGVHATIAGVLLGFCVPARPIHGEETSRTQQMEPVVRPLSAGIALPVFAFFAAGISLSGDSGPLGALADPVAIAIVVALVVGKLVGVLGVTALVTKSLRCAFPRGSASGICSRWGSSPGSASRCRS